MHRRSFLAGLITALVAKKAPVDPLEAALRPPMAAVEVTGPAHFVPGMITYSGRIENLLPIRSP